ncbi:MAG: hypothetical protein EHM45_24390 [Desulfobacteraceae bacterium]|nr:MAG: hypothetical protein EHM45_24390 [Desulfobacteraceae bacterium]
MKTSNKIFIIGGIFLLIMLTAGFGYISTRGPWCDSKGRSFSGFHERGFHSGTHQEEASEFILWRMDKKAAELHLTVAQKMKYDELKNSIQSFLLENSGNHQRLEERLRTELNKESADMKSLMKSFKAEINALAGLLNNNLDRLADFYDSLDSVQKRIIRDEITAILAYRHS